MKIAYGRFPSCTGHHKTSIGVIPNQGNVFSEPTAHRSTAAVVVVMVSGQGVGCPYIQQASKQCRHLHHSWTAAAHTVAAGILEGSPDRDIVVQQQQLIRWQQGYSWDHQTAAAPGAAHTVAGHR